MLPMFTIYSAIYDILEMDGRITEAICLLQDIQHELAPAMWIENEEGQWKLSELYRMDTAGASAKRKGCGSNAIIM